MWYGYLIQIEAAVIEEIILWTVFCCQEVGSQIIESAIPRRISEVGPIRIWNFMFSTDFICEGVHSKITGKGLPILHWWEYMGIFHIRRSHGVGNHDFFVIKFFSVKQDYLLPKKSRYDKIQGIKTKRR